RARDALCEIGRHRLEDDRERAGLFERHGVRENLLRRLVATSLYLEAAEGMNALRREPHVADHGDARSHDAMDLVGYLLAAFELRALARALLQELAGALDCLGRRDLIAHEREIADEMSSREPTCNRAAVVGHLLERDRKGRRQPLDDHAERVA